MPTPIFILLLILTYKGGRSHATNDESAPVVLQKMPPKPACYRAYHVEFWTEKHDCIACRLKLGDSVVFLESLNTPVVDRSYLLSSPGALNGSYVRLNYLGHEEASYLYKRVRDAREAIDLIDWIKERDDLTKEIFVSEYRTRNKKVQMGIHAIAKTYDGLYENLAVNLAPVFHSREGGFLRRRFPEMWKWMTNYERNGEKPPQQDQRNASAHRCGVGSVYEKHAHDDVRRIQFIPRTFWDNLDEWLPKLKPEFDDIIDILRQDLPGIRELKLEKSPDGPSHYYR